MNNKKKSAVSVCIVTYNNEDNIERVLRSILSHTKGVRLELYVYDNASSDRTVSIVQEKFPQVWLLRGKKNKGFGYGHNKVLQRLTSKYHVIVNPDILLQSDVLTQMADYMEEHPEVHMAVPKLLNLDGSEQFTPKREPKLHYMIGGRLERYGSVFKRWRDEYTLRGQNVEEPIEVGFCSGCFMMIRTETFRKVGGFDTRYFLYNEDADLTRTVKAYGKTMYLPQITVVHFWARAYMKDIKYLGIQIASMVKYFWKWRGTPDA